MNRQKVNLIVTLLLAITGMSLAYYAGLRNGSTANDTNAELEALRASQNDAAVVRRVSQQMEDIAYQQKAVSDEQRDRAREQSELAIAMRDRAEQESRLAREAERKARAAAQEAREQREAAMEHQKVAEEQRDAANHAKSVTDTLNYRAIGRTLGSSSYIQHESGNTDLAVKLAYTSWYMLDRFGGNTYQPETFSTLSLCSNTYASISTKKGGAVRALHPLYGVGCVAVTDYGEIEIIRKMGVRRSVVLQNDDYDFRDVWADTANIYALSYHGQLCVTDFKKPLKTIELPEGDYLKMMYSGQGRMLIAAKRHILMLDLKSGSVLGRHDFDNEITALSDYHGGTCLFFADGTAMHLAQNLSVSPLHFNEGRVITAAHYEERLKMLVLGCENGDLLIVDNNDRHLTTAVYHVARITDIAVVGDVMISASYDRNVLVWNLPFYKVSDTESISDLLGLEDGMLGNGKTGIASEWLTPVVLQGESWPFALCQFSDYEIAAGTADGHVERYNVSASNMADQLKEKYDIGLSQSDWDHYVGSTVPFIDFSE